MSIIKIHLFRDANQKQQKYLLTFIPEVHNTVKNFLEFALRTLDINTHVDDLIIQHQGYMLPHCLDGKILQNTSLLTIKIKQTKRMSPPFQFWTSQKVPQTNQNVSQVKNNHQRVNQIDQQQSLSSSSTPKFSEDGLSRENSPIVMQKIHNKKNIVEKKNHQKQLKHKKKYIPASSQSQAQQQEQIPAKAQKQKHHHKNIKKAKSQSSQPQQVKQDSGLQSSSQSSEQQQLPRITKSKKDQVKQKIQAKKKTVQIIQKTKQKKLQKEQIVQKTKQKKHQKVHHQTQKLNNRKIEIRRQQSFGQDQQPDHKVQTFKKSVEVQKPVSKPVTVTYAQRKKIIEDNDIQSSDSSQQEKVIKPVKISIQNQPKMVPPSLRNKIQVTPIQKGALSSKIQQKPSPNAFKKHMQQQWIIITKQIIQKVNKQIIPTSEQKTIIRPLNLIKFKEIELDEERFVPITSEWIQGTVDRIENDGKLILSKVSQLGKGYRQRYEIYEYNMVELQINRNHLTKDQVAFLGLEKKNDNQNQTAKIVQQIQSVSQQPPKQTPQKVQTDQKNSLQKFICGQVHFYFSDKNYPYDLFMQMHANKNPQRYIPIRFLLNFPKIKKVLKDQNKLFYYLIQDEKREIRNFQIDQEKRMVRKKLVNPTENKVQNQDQLIKQEGQLPQE